MALPFFTIFTVITALVVTPLTATEQGEDPSSAYNLLQDYGFPVGLLPKGVTSYTLNKQTGQFSVSFNGSCSFAIENSYPLKYKQTIKGYITNRKLTRLQGVSVKVVLFWFNIDEISSNGDELEFHVGILSAEFPIDNFYESPQCGCGFNCVDERKVKKGGVEIETTTTRFVSSS